MLNWKHALLIASAVSVALPMAEAVAQQGLDLLTEPMELEIGKEHTTILLSWNHSGFSTSTAVIRDFEGMVHLDPANIENSSVHVTMDIGSLDTFFQGRTDSLQSERFFNVAQFPEATFESTEVVKTGDTTADVKGNLTLLGMSYPLTLATTFNKAGDNMGAFIVGFDATATIARADYGLTDLATAVGTDVTIHVSTELIRPAAEAPAAN